MRTIFFVLLFLWLCSSVQGKPPQAPSLKSGVCNCESDPCPSALCQAYGGPGNCPCTTTRKVKTPQAPPIPDHWVDVEVKSKAPAAKPRASVIVDADHTCPKCGAYQNIVHRQAGGTHSHRCSNCGTEWWHRDPGVSVQSPTVMSPSVPLQYASPGCSGPNCANPSFGQYTIPQKSGWYLGKNLGR